MIYVVSDDPDGVELIARLRQGLGDRDVAELNTTVFDGQQVTFDSLVGASEAMPFLADRRLVLVRGLLSRFEPTDKKGHLQEGSSPSARKAPSIANQLREYLPKLPDSTVIIFLEPMAISKKNSVYEGLVAAGAQFAQTPEMAGDALANWIERRVSAKGGRIGKAASHVLAGYWTRDLRALDLELDKLVAFASAAEIDSGTVNQLVSAAQERNVYKLGDAMAEGKQGVALDQLRLLLQGGGHPLYILAMMTRHFRLLIQIQELRGQGLSSQAIASRIRSQSFVVERLTRQLRHYRAADELERVLRRLLEYDEAGKTGKGDLTINLELLIGELAQGTRRPV